MALAAQVKVLLSATLTRSLDLQEASSPLRIEKSLTFSDGAGALQASKLWSDRRTITDDAPDIIDLAGVLTDIYGQAVTFAEIKAMMVVADAANLNHILLGGAATSPGIRFDTWVGDASDAVRLRPGAVFLLAATDATGYVVTAATGDILQVANSADDSPITPVTYDIVLIGN